MRKRDKKVKPEPVEATVAKLRDELAKLNDKLTFAYGQIIKCEPLMGVIAVAYQWSGYRAQALVFRVDALGYAEFLNKVGAKTTFIQCSRENASTKALQIQGVAKPIPEKGWLVVVSTKGRGSDQWRCESFHFADSLNGILDLKPVDWADTAFAPRPEPVPVIKPRTPRSKKA